MSFKWNDNLVKEFCRVYSAGPWGQYKGCKTIETKLQRFKQLKQEKVKQKIKIEYIIK